MTLFSEVRVIRGDGNVFQILNYLERMEIRMTNKRLSENFRFYGESDQDIEKHHLGKSGFMIPEWLDMGNNIEEWLVYATSLERTNYYLNSEEFESKLKASRAKYRELRKGFPKEFTIARRDEEIVKIRTKECVTAVRRKRDEIKTYLLNICSKSGFNTYQSPEFEAHLTTVLGQAWDHLILQKKSDIERFHRNREGFHNEIQELIKQGIDSLKHTPWEGMEARMLEHIKDPKIAESPGYIKAYFAGLKTYGPEELEVLFGNSNETQGYDRMNIPASVKQEVWRRDLGECTKCGSRRNLEYDHIIPVSKGGSNTARNIELLCQDCNRQKSNSIL